MKVRLLLAVLAVLSLITYSRSTCAQGQTSGNFYYPTGSINFRVSTRWLAADCDGSGEYIIIGGDPKYHVGADIVPTDRDEVDGSPIYAISDGLVVYRSDKLTSGWGDGNIALVIKHELSNGQPFFAVYGHIRSNLNEGKLVYAGKSFATIGPFFDEKGTPIHHLHFGINLGHVNPSTGELDEPRTNLGIMSCSNWPDRNGFENPITWIETQKSSSTVPPLDQQAKQEMVKREPTKQSPVYIAKDSRVYHHDRNCSNITTTDGLMEFSSPQKAEASGGILCEHCDPSTIAKEEVLGGNIDVVVNTEQLTKHPSSYGEVDIPPPKMHVEDHAEIIDEQTENNLNGILAGLEKETGAQMVVLTIKTTGGIPIDQFSIDLAREWKLGQLGINNGVLVVIAREDRKYCIQVGTGLKRILTNDFCAKVGETIFVPNFRIGNYSKGINQGSNAIINRIAPDITYENYVRKKKLFDDFSSSTLKNKSQIEDKLEGAWEITAFGMVVTQIFSKDGTFIGSGIDKTYIGKWSTNGKQIKIEFTGESVGKGPDLVTIIYLDESILTYKDVNNGKIATWRKVK